MITEPGFKCPKNYQKTARSKNNMKLIFDAVKVGQIINTGQIIITRNIPFL